MRWYYLKCLLFIILLAACEKDVYNPEVYGSISGSILNVDGHGLSGARVETAPPTHILMTDSAGNFRLDDIPAGDYSIVAEKPDFKKATASISVIQGRETRVSLILEEKTDVGATGNIQGRLLDGESNLPIAQAHVSTVPPTLALLTDAEGRFEINSIPAGDYTLKAKKSGFQPDSVQVAVTGGKTTGVSLLLTPSRATAYNRPARPIPASQSSGISDTVTLRWSVDDARADALLRFTVLLYESGDPLGKTLAENTTDTALLASYLKFNTTYFWQVIARDQHGNTTPGDLWSFKTAPFPVLSYLYNRRIEGRREIFAADAALLHSIRLTDDPGEAVYPQFSPQTQWIAYVSRIDGKQQLFVMRQDGTEKAQVTELPVAGYHNYGNGFCWSPDGGQLLYSHYDKLYRINRDGTNLTLIATAPAGRHFLACDWTGATREIVVQTIGSDINDSELYVMREDGSDMRLQVPDFPGRIESPSFSIDGRTLMFTRDRSGFASPVGRQLDACVYLMDRATGHLSDLAGQKPPGSNDTYPRFSPDGAYILFEQGSNVEGSTKSIWMMDLDGGGRRMLIRDAEAPDM